jgi:hypothetical protein
MSQRPAVSAGIRPSNDVASFLIFNLSYFASAADASNIDGRNAALRVLASRGAGFSPDAIVITEVRNQGLTYISVSVTRSIVIPLLGREVLMTGRARAIDEASL